MYFLLMTIDIYFGLLDCMKGNLRVSHYAGQISQITALSNRHDTSQLTEPSH